MHQITRGRWGRAVLCAAVVFVVLVGVGGCAGRSAWRTEPFPGAGQAADLRAGVQRLGDLEVRVRVVADASSITISSEKGLTVSYASSVKKLPRGRWKFRLDRATPCRQLFHVFARSYQPHELDEAHRSMRTWRSKGYSPKLVTLGYRFASKSRRSFDTRVHWFSVAQLDTRNAAETLKGRLQREGVGAWVRAESAASGTGTVSIGQPGRRPSVQVPAPMTITAPRGLEVWPSGDKQPQVYRGALALVVDASGHMEVIETLPLEDYLAGVLPAEMPSSWPDAALKAQAVAARSEVLAHMDTRHTFERFNFCAEVHCRAYRGAGQRRPSTDKAVAATRGQVIAHAGAVVPAVFCANCGGWTEDNDAVWAGPPHPALRGVPDFPARRGTKTPAQRGLIRWLKSPPKAYCDGDTGKFRWYREFPEVELSDLVNKQHRIGRIVDIIPGERGVSGRLKSIKIVGSAGTVTVERELAIRRTFGSLPSAAFIIEVQRGQDGTVVYRFTGAGNGHGVGMCQHGAHGMARQGASYRDILKHYFRGVTIEGLR